MLLACGLSAFSNSLFAQGSVNFTILQTGGGTPLVSDSQTMSLSGVPSPQLTFDFGFYSDEVPTPNSLLDSFTITVQDSFHTAVLVTTDATGPAWVPPTMGGVSLADSDVVRMLIDPPTDAPISGRGVAYSVSYSLAQFTGSDVTVYFDLFDNQDSTPSLAWHTTPRLTSVPEPGIMALSGLASLLFLIRRNHSHAAKGP